MAILQNVVTGQTVMTAIVLIAALGLLVVYVRTHTLEQIRGDVYQIFLQMEHTYLKSGSGQKKLDEAVDRAYELLPSWAKIFFTRERLKQIINAWFGKVKDLLDDGKANKSISDGKQP